MDERAMMSWLPLPNTLEEAVKRLLKLEDIELFKKMPEGEVTARTHHFFGMHLRNEWGLWAGSPLARDLHRRFGLIHADDMSGVIMLCLHREVNGLPWDAEGIAAGYKAHWDKSGKQPTAVWLHWESTPKKESA